MGYVTTGANGPNIYATDLDGQNVLLYSADAVEAAEAIGHRALTASTVFDFTDKHPSNAKALVELTGAFKDDNFLQIENYLNAELVHYSECVLLQESAQDITALYKQAEIMPPRIMESPSQSNFTRFFNAHITPRAQKILRFITDAPIPRI